MSTVFFLSQLDSGIFLPAECFPLTFDINVVNCFVITSEKLVLEMPLTDEKKKPCVTMGYEFFKVDLLQDRICIAVYLLCPFGLGNSWPK